MTTSELFLEQTQNAGAQSSNDVQTVTQSDETPPDWFKPIDKFDAVVQGKDQDFFKLQQQLFNAGKENQLWDRYKPRRMLIYAGRERKLVDEVEIPPEGLSKEEFDGILEENGYPNVRCVVRVQRGYRYMVSHTFSAHRKQAPAARVEEAMVPAEEEEEVEEVFITEEEYMEEVVDKLLSHPPTGPIDRLSAIVCSPYGPEWSEKMVAVVGPAFVNLMVMAYEQLCEVKVNAEVAAEERKLKLMEERALPEHVYAGGDR
jgi:hypothetical protein